MCRYFRIRFVVFTKYATFTKERAKILRAGLDRQVKTYWSSSVRRLRWEEEGFWFKSCLWTKTLKVGCVDSFKTLPGCLWATYCTHKFTNALTHLLQWMCTTFFVCTWKSAWTEYKTRHPPLFNECSVLLCLLCNRQQKAVCQHCCPQHGSSTQLLHISLVDMQQHKYAAILPFSCHNECRWWCSIKRICRTDRKPGQSMMQWKLKQGWGVEIWVVRKRLSAKWTDSAMIRQASERENWREQSWVYGQTHKCERTKASCFAEMMSVEKERGQTAEDCVELEVVNLRRSL